MEIISPQHCGKLFYDKFSIGFLTPDKDLLLIDQFTKNNQFSMTLQQYELSKESIIWLSSDLFAELQFDDVWLIFSNSEKLKVQRIFAILTIRIAEIPQRKTPRVFQRHFYKIIDELETELAEQSKNFALA